MFKRIKRVNEIIKQNISNLILKQGYFEKDVLVTVTQVKTSSDLGTTRVFVSVLPEDKFESVIKILNGHIYDLQQKLNKKLFMKRVPKIVFEQETRTKEAARIEKLLDELKKQRKTDNIQAEDGGNGHVAK